MRVAMNFAVVGAEPRVPVLRRLLVALAGLLDGLAPRRRPAECRDLPPEWYRLPPY